jgi:hypothetical protein
MTEEDDDEEYNFEIIRNFFDKSLLRMPRGAKARV